MKSMVVKSIRMKYSFRNVLDTPSALRICSEAGSLAQVTSGFKVEGCGFIGSVRVQHRCTTYS